MKRLIAFYIFISLSFSAFGQTKYLHCGSVLDCIGDTPAQEKTIVIIDNQIHAVMDGYVAAPDTAELVDLRNLTVMPGFMDMHIHIEGELNPARYIERYTMEPQDVALRSTLYAERTLMAGFTSVRDLGGSGVNVSLRTAINKGYIKGPRIYTAEKSIATTGGHADPTNGMKSDMMGDPGPAEGVINSAADAKKAVRQRYKNGADVIKITSTGGVLSVAKDGKGAQFTPEEIEAVVSTANDYGFVTAAHAHGPEGMLRAVQGGIHSIEHGTMMTPEIMEEMKKRGTYLVATISAGKFTYEKALKPGFFPEIIRPKALEVGPLIQATFGKAYRAGVKIAFGTDSGVSPHGQNAKEFEYMVEAGMPEYEAIKSATVEASKLLRVYDKFGSIESGKMADIIAVKGNPLEDITILQDVSFVMKDGVVYKNQ